MRDDRFRRYLFPAHAGTLALLWAGGLAAAGLSLVLPRVIGRLTNLFAGGRAVDMPTVSRALGWLVASQVAFAAVSFARRRAELRLAEAVARTLMLDLFARVVRFPADFFRDREVDRINARVLDDANAVAKVWVNAAVVAPVALASMAAFGAVMVFDNVFLGLCMIPLALLSRYFVLFDRTVQAQARAAREVWDALRTQGSETVTLVPELRGHHAFDYGLQGLRRSFDALRRVLRATATTQATFSAISPLVNVVQIGTLYWLGAALCAGHFAWAQHGPRLTWGGVIEFMLIVQLFQKPSTDLGLFLIDWRMTRENQRRVAEFLDQPVPFDRPGGPPLPAAADVAYDDVSVTSAAGVPILTGVSLTIEPGEHVAFCGPAGCGKSTAMALVTRGAEPAKGSLRMAGRPVDEYDLASVARHVAFVAQKPLLMDASIRHNILLGLRRRGGGGLRDDDGPLDCSRLPGVTDLAALDAELVRVVQAVGLEADVLRKCLDNPAPPTSPEAAAVRGHTAAVRAAVTRALAGTADVVPFAADAWFPGTVGDNLLGPGGMAADTTADVAHLLDAEGLAALVRLGGRRLRAERALAVKLAQQAPALIAFLQTDPPADATGSFASALLGVALSTEADAAAAYDRAGPAAFRERILAARGVACAADPACGRRWADVAAGRPLDGLSVRENLVGGRANPRVLGAAERVDAALRAALADAGVLSAAVLLGLEARVGEGGKYLSGGQRQKVTIARAVLKNPSLLLLDEATASLDEASQARVTDLLRAEFKGRTVVSISHRLSTVRDYDRIVVLDRGEIAQAGPYDQLAAADGIFRNLVDQEQGGKDARPAADAPAPHVPNADGLNAAELQRSLALSDVFATLASEQLAFLVDVARVVHVEPGTVLFRRGEPGTDLFLVLDGGVTFWPDAAPDATTPDGPPVAAVGPGKVFGELAVFGYGARTLTARVGPPTRLLVIGRDDLIRLTTADPRIGLALLRAVSRRLIETNEKAYGAPTAGR